MKKTVLSILCMAFFVFNANFAFATTTSWNSETNLKRVNAIGTKILSANKLPQNITFKVSENEEANAYANLDKEVYIYQGLLNKVENDDELAGVISHEVGHIVNSHLVKQGFFSGFISYIGNNFSSTKAQTASDLTKELIVLNYSRKGEYEADLTAVDLMVQAGYNPLALISVLNKICGNSLDIIESHPSGEKRLMNIFDYANYNYPNIVKANYKTDSYQKALSLIYANLKIRKESPRKLAKVEKQQKKLKMAKLKRAKKMITGTSGWDISYTVLNSLSTSESEQSK